MVTAGALQSGHASVPLSRRLPVHATSVPAHAASRHSSEKRGHRLLNERFEAGPQPKARMWVEYHRVVDAHLPSLRGSEFAFCFRAADLDKPVLGPRAMQTFGTQRSWIPLCLIDELSDGPIIGDFDEPFGVIDPLIGKEVGSPWCIRRGSRC